MFIRQLILRGLLGVFLVSGAPALAQEEPLKINTAFAMPLSSPDQTGMFDKLMQAVFARLGHQVVVQMPPAERALRYANAGIDDGDGPRIEGLDQTYPNLIRVPEQVIQVNFVAFTTGDFKFEIDDWSALDPYHVGIVKGWKILERNITGAQSLTQARTPEELMSMLGEGKIQVAVIGRLTGKYMADEVGVENLNVLTPPLAVRSMYLYLHKKHADLVTPVAEALRDLKKSGEYDKIMKLPE